MTLHGMAELPSPPEAIACSGAASARTSPEYLRRILVGHPSTRTLVRVYSLRTLRRALHPPGLGTSMLMGSPIPQLRTRSIHSLPWDPIKLVCARRTLTVSTRL